MSSEHSNVAMENRPEPGETARQDRIPVLTERVSAVPGAAGDPELAALVERVLDDILPALRAAVTTACEDHLAAARGARPD